MKILMVHQGSELYGSDRSFVSAVEAVINTGASVDVIIPERGEINSLIDKLNCKVLYATWNH